MTNGKKLIYKLIILPCVIIALLCGSVIPASAFSIGGSFNYTLSNYDSNSIYLFFYTDLTSTVRYIRISSNQSAYPYSDHISAFNFINIGDVCYLYLRSDCYIEYHKVLSGVCTFSSDDSLELSEYGSSDWYLNPIGSVGPDAFGNYRYYLKLVYKTANNSWSSPSDLSSSFNFFSFFQNSLSNISLLSDFSSIFPSVTSSSLSNIVNNTYSGSVLGGYEDGVEITAPAETTTAAEPTTINAQVSELASKFDQYASQQQSEWDYDPSFYDAENDEVVDGTYYYNFSYEHSLEDKASSYYNDLSSGVVAIDEKMSEGASNINSFSSIFSTLWNALPASIVVAVILCFIVIIACKAVAR